MSEKCSRRRIFQCWEAAAKPSRALCLGRREEETGSAAPTANGKKISSLSACWVIAPGPRTAPKCCRGVAPLPGPGTRALRWPHSALLCRCICPPSPEPPRDPNPGTYWPRCYGRSHPDLSPTWPFRCLQLPKGPTPPPQFPQQLGFHATRPAALLRGRASGVLPAQAFAASTLLGPPGGGGADPYEKPEWSLACAGQWGRKEGIF